MANINVDSNGATVQGTSGADSFTGVNGNYLIYGPETLVGGAGDDSYAVSGMSEKVVEQPDGGTDRIIANGTYILPANVENLTVWSTYAAFGNDQDNRIETYNNNLVDGGRGNDILFGGAGAQFQFDAHSDWDLIPNWYSNSVIRLTGYSQFTSFADVQKTMVQVGNDVIINFDANDGVRVQNVKISDFTAANFQLALDPAKLGAMTFDDEFNSLSTKVRNVSGGTWDTEYGYGKTSNAVDGRTLAGNGEEQLYVDSTFTGSSNKSLGLNPFSINNGVLTITEAPTPAADKAAAYGFNYTSGALTTRETFAQTYGYFEARMELPQQSGTWPAFWLVRKDGTWPPELDVMEDWGNNTAVGTVHTQQTGTHTMSSASDYIPDADTAMHTYGILWTPTTLTWYIDGVAVNSVPTPADMNSPMYMILNLAVSPGTTDPNLTSQMKVDYVRAYSLTDLPTFASGTASLSSGSTYMGAVAGVADGFNQAYYAAHNPDVVASGMDLYTHYLTYGKAEGRLPYDPTVSAYTGTTSGSASTTTTGTSSSATAGTTTTAASSGAGTTTASGSSSTSTSAATTKVADHGYWGANPALADGFNIEYYLAHNPDVAKSGMNPYYHYLTYGKNEGRLPYDPDASDAATVSSTAHGYWGKVAGVQDGFNAAYYAAHNPDVVASGMDLLTHYEQYGKSEGRLAYDPTDTSATSSSSTSTSAATTKVADHGYWGANPALASGFNVDYYLAHNPDVAKSGMNPYYHYLTYGKNEGRLPYDPDASDAATVSSTAHGYWGKVAGVQDGFNAAYYAAHNADVVASGMDLLTHYELYGKGEGRLAYDPTDTSATSSSSTSTSAAATHASWGAVAGVQDGFNAAYYAAHNLDVVASGMDLLTHYELYGKKEGRTAYDPNGAAADTASASYTTLAAPSGSATLVATVSHDTFKMPTGFQTDTITGFDTANDKLDVSSLIAKYGTPTFTDMANGAGTSIHWSGGETIQLLGVSNDAAHHAVLG